MPSYFVDNVAANTSTSSISPTTGNTPLAAYIGVLRNAFISCSFIRTTQSGSVDDLNTLKSPTGGNELVAFDVFAFNDSWQATHPLFMKVEYRTTINPTGLGLHAVELGSAHNGSGSITSVDKISIPLQGAGGGTYVTQTDKVYASGDGSYFALSSMANATLNCQVLVCERFYDVYGNPTGSGFHIISTGPGTSGRLAQQATLYGTVAPQREEYNVINSRPSRVPSVYGGNLILGLIYPFVGKPMPPSPNILLGESTTFSTVYSTINYKVYDKQYVYLNTGGTFDSSQRLYSNGRWLVRI